MLPTITERLLNDKITAMGGLIEIVNDISRMTSMFQRNEIVPLINILTNEYFLEISMKLYKLKQCPTVNNDYETFRVLINNTLYMLFKSCAAYSNIFSLENLVEIYKKDSTILRDTEKLKEFLAELANQKSLFGEVFNLNVTVAPEIKEEYLIYFELYGKPENMVFEPDKLAKIKQDLLVHAGILPRCNDI